MGLSPGPALNAVCIVSLRDGCCDCGHGREVVLMDVAPENEWPIKAAVVT